LKLQPNGEATSLTRGIVAAARSVPRRDLEAVVLAEALRLHLEHRVIVYGRRTAVFD
jgi:formyltetrahydrofolate hydrolase